MAWGLAIRNYLVSKKKKLVHNPLDLNPMSPMAETPFGEWLIENQPSPRTLHGVLKQYFDTDDEGLRGQFAGELHYIDNDGKACLLSVYTQYKYVFETYCRSWYIPEALRFAKNLGDLIDLDDISKARKHTSQLYIQGYADLGQDASDHQRISFYCRPQTPLVDWIDRSMLYKWKTSEARYMGELSIARQSATEDCECGVRIRYLELCGGSTVGSGLVLNKDHAEGLFTLLGVDVDAK